MTDSRPGRWVENAGVGQRLVHPVPRTLHGGDLALYMALSGERRPLSSSTEFARSLGFAREVVHDLLVFRLVYGACSQGEPVNVTLGFADVHFRRPVYPGDTLVSESEVVGRHPASDSTHDVVYIRCRGSNQKGQEVISFVRWRRVASGSVTSTAPFSIPAAVPAKVLDVPETLNLQRFPDLLWATGSETWWDDYQPGQRLASDRSLTLGEAETTLAQRLFAAPFGGPFTSASGHASPAIVANEQVLSLGWALAYDGLENVLTMAAWNGLTTFAPARVGDTLSAWTDVVECCELGGSDTLGTLRLRLVVVKNVDPTQELPSAAIASGVAVDPRLVLALDAWALIPRRRP